MREIDYMAVEAAKDQQLLNQFIKQNEKFILKSVVAVTHHYISSSDDEWSIALLAFTQAVESYQFDKGSFYSFAELIIRRRLIDYIRKEQKHKVEISVNPSVFDTDPEENEEDVAIHLAVAKQVSSKENTSIKDEIEVANETFSHYGFSFFDLTDCSPHAKKTKLSCAKVVVYIVSNPILIKQLRSSKQLPLKIIEKNTKVPRKLLERHRKYIIAAVEILSGEYPNLAEYMQHIRKEICK